MNFGQSLGFLCFLISLYILWEIRQLLLLIFFAVILAVVLNRLVLKLKKFSLRRTTAVFIITTVILIILNLLLLVILPPFIEQFQLLLSILPKVPEKINELINSFEASKYYWKSFPGLDNFFKGYKFLPDNFLNDFITFFSNVFIIIFQIVFVFLLTVFFLLNPQKYRRYFRQLFPSFYRYRVDDILDKSEIAIVSWLGGITINSLFIGSLSGIGLFS